MKKNRASIARSLAEEAQNFIPRRRRLKPLGESVLTRYDEIKEQDDEEDEEGDELDAMDAEDGGVDADYSTCLDCLETAHGHLMAMDKCKDTKACLSLRDKAAAQLKKAMGSLGK